MPKKTSIQISADMTLLRKELIAAREEFRKFNKDAVKSASGIKDLENQADKAGKKLRGFSKILNDIKGSLSGVFGKFTLAGVASNAISSALFKVQTLFTGLVRGSIEASSALTELDSKARVVFGDGFNLVEKQAKAISTEVGRAKSAILGFSADIGAVFEAMGIGGRALGDMSTQIAKLAVDMASFTNTSDEDAFQALQSGLVGMVQPLRRYGVVLTQTNLEQFAQEKGLKQSIKTMNQAQLVALRYAFIMDKTTTAQGDAARTAESFANQTRRLEGEWTELNEQLGKAATPALADGLGVLSAALQNTRLFVSALTSDIKALIEAMGSIPGVGFIGNAVKSVAETALDSTNPLIKRLVAPIVKNIGGRVSSRINDAKSGEEDPGTVTDPLALVNQLAGAGGTDKAGAKKALDEALKAYEEIAKRNKTYLEQERDRLKLRKEMGVITKREERQLDAINNRIEFSGDKIADATKEWQDQVRALQQVEDKIKDINKQILDERKNLQDTIDGIEEDTNKSKVGVATDLIKELKDLREKPNKTAVDENRIREIDGFLDPLRQTEEGTSILKEADQIAGIEDPFELIDREKNARIDSAKEEAEARIEALQGELKEAEKNKREIERMEEEKKQAVLNALADRKARTFQVYGELEVRLTEHVNKQVSELNRYKAAVMSLTALETFGVGQFQNESIGNVYNAGKQAVLAGGLRRASGGPIYGPGSSTSDSIPAFLSNGEYVINARATSMYRPLIEKINRMSLPVQRFASGGEVTNNNQRSASVVIKNYGKAAEVFADPRRAKWVKRTFL